MRFPTFKLRRRVGFSGSAKKARERERAVDEKIKSITSLSSVGPPADSSVDLCSDPMSRGAIIYRGCAFPFDPRSSLNDL